MADYRAYFIRRDGHTAEVPLVCSSDVEAIRQVKLFVGEFIIELWSGDRVVTRLAAKTK